MSSVTRGDSMSMVAARTGLHLPPLRLKCGFLRLLGFCEDLLEPQASCHEPKLRQAPGEQHMTRGSDWPRVTGVLKQSVLHPAPIVHVGRIPTQSVRLVSRPMRIRAPSKTAADQSAGNHLRQRLERRLRCRGRGAALSLPQLQQLQDGSANASV